MPERGINKTEVYRDAIRLGLKNLHFWQLFILGVLLVYCVLFYYFGELIDLLEWETLRLGLFYSAHDLQRAFFLVPVIYTSYIFRTRGSLIMTLITGIAILPRMILTEDTEPFSRVIVFIIIAGAIGYMTARFRNSQFPLCDKEGSP